jgi:hypothetical protein
VVPDPSLSRRKHRFDARPVSGRRATGVQAQECRHARCGESLVIASKARCGPIPLRWAYGALRGISPARAEEALGRMGFRAVREGFW